MTGASIHHNPSSFPHALALVRTDAIIGNDNRPFLRGDREVDAGGVTSPIVQTSKIAIPHFNPHNARGLKDWSWRCIPDGVVAALEIEGAQSRNLPDGLHEAGPTPWSNSVVADIQMQVVHGAPGKVCRKLHGCYVRHGITRHPNIPIRHGGAQE